MKSLEILRSLDSVGRIVLPIDLRKKFNLASGDMIEIFVENEVIVLKKCVDKCSFCESTENLTKLKEKFICSECREQFKNKLK